MANNCSIVLKADNLPSVLKKVEFYMFRAIDRSGISYFDIAKTGLEDKLGLLAEAKKLIEADILKYKGKSNSAKTPEDAEFYESFAANLQGINANWEAVLKNFLKYYGGLINLKTKFKTDADGLVDMDETSDEEQSILTKIAFDQPANEIDPIDNIDKTVELFIRGLQKKNIYDEYGFNVLVDYGNFIRTLSSDLENTVSTDEILARLESLKENTLEYQVIIDKIKPKQTDKASDIQFRINFRNSFAKAAIPTYITSIEDSVIKVFEATIAKRNLYQQKIASNFFRQGMPVKVGDNSYNLAHQENDAWIIDKSDLGKIKKFIEDKNIPIGEKIERRIQFLEAFGFEFSPESRKLLFKLKDVKTYIDFISNQLIKVLETGGTIKDPIKAVSNNIYVKGSSPIRGQKGPLNLFFDFEVKYNRAYNIERSVINSDGNREYVIQNHNNFTVINKYLSDPEQYPTLQSILNAEPSLVWMDPSLNPSISESIFLNSLFFYDPADPNYGKRRRVYNGKFSATEGEFVKIEIVNAGGQQTKSVDDSGIKTTSSSSTGLEAIDKLFHDINLFSQKGFSSIQRLSDKSTDLGIFMNYYSDPVTGYPVKRILGGTGTYKNIYETEQFIVGSLNALRDVLRTKYLAQKGFYKSLTEADISTSDPENFGVFTDIIDRKMKRILNQMVKNAKSIDDIDNILQDGTEEKELVVAEMTEYFEDYTKRIINLLKPVTDIVPTENLIGKGKSLEDTVRFYLANTFLSDIENLKVFFGDPIFFKAFHKRNSKDSATGIFTFIEDSLIAELNDYSAAQGYGANTNLSGRLLADRLFDTKFITKEQRDELLLKQLVSKSYKSAVLKDVMFESNADKIIKNIERLKSEGKISDEAYALFKKNIKTVIEQGYKEGNEADGQGKCTFDFYRIMSILTSNWSDKHEEVYRKIVLYSHYDELVTKEKDEAKKAEYLQKRDAVGYDPLEDVYFPPKKFQYSGPMEYMKAVDGQMFTQMIPIFDKFSLQPLIPTIIKGTTDAELAKQMEYNGIGYVKFESGTKVESPAARDSVYVDYNSSKPETRKIETFDKKLTDGTLEFKSEQTLFFTHLKEQVRIDAAIHDSTPFGSQMRKLILLNILGADTTHNRKEFEELYSRYVRLIDALVKNEKRSLYARMGVSESKDGNLSIRNMEKMVQFFFDEIDRKGQDSNIKKALKYNEQTKSFEIPLDAAVQAQILENIIISSINNRLVRNKMNGSMLTQVSITGSDRVKFSKEASEKALETFGNSDLSFYDLVEENGKLVVQPMQVKIGLTGQWKSLLNLKHPDGNVINTLERLNEAIKDNAWKNKHKGSITLTGYRIPTGGLNFIDVMEVAEFLPAQFGDAIILPSEIVIKNGSDFDIDKLFVYYPNLVKVGANTGELVTDESIPEGIQNSLYNVIAIFALHPANYMQLVTPSVNYHIMPIINEVYKKLYGSARKQTDYKNTQLVDREYNLKKFLSLLNGKSDLGIAAVANTFNVLYQLSLAKGNPEWFKGKKLRSFFDNKNIKISPETGFIQNIFFGDVYDEDGVYKSEFFTEFINAFVDVAKDDYVFAVNVVSELSPIMFYMKYLGLSTEKIIPFINQPVIRDYIKNLSKYENSSVKTYLQNERNKIAKGLQGLTQAEIDEDDRLKALDIRLKNLKYSTRRKALSETLRNLGFDKTESTASAIYAELKSVNVNSNFTKEKLLDNIKPANTELSKLSPAEKFAQLSYIYELLNLKVQSDSLSDTQTFQKFDTSPYQSSFDVYSRSEKYTAALNGKTILDPVSAKAIVKTSPIAPLNAGNEIASLLELLFPIRNNKRLNRNLLSSLSDPEATSIRYENDRMSYARTYKNDLMSYILYNFLDKSTAGKDFFQKEFNTDKNIGEYVAEMVETNKLIDNFNKIKSLPGYTDLEAQFPFIKNIIIRTGDKNQRIKSFKFIENSSNPVDRSSVVLQFKEIANLESVENKEIRQFFRDLALYATFQSGYNFGEFSYTSVTPVDLINRLYGFAADEFLKLSEEDSSNEINEFERKFGRNNPVFYNRASNDTPTRESSKRGKWYSSEKLTFKPQVKTTQPTTVSTDAKADVILPIGTSGSGKSTFIKSLPQENLVIISPDEMRVEFTGDINNKSKDKEIYIEAAKRAIEAVKNGKQVVFDTTNLTKEKRRPFIEAIKKAIPSANIQYKLMELNPELAKQRIKAQIARGENRANVSDETIDRHAASYLQMLEDIKTEGITEYKPTSINPLVAADVLPPIEQNFTDGQGGRKMQPQFAGKSTMDLILSGDRTRTTRSKTEMARYLKDYNVNRLSELVGKIIRMTDKQGRAVYTKITNVAKFTQEYQDKTWMKEGWDKATTDKLVGQYPYALEFEVVKTQQSVAEITPKPLNQQTIKDKIDSWIANNLPWSIETPSSELSKMYEKEQLNGETIEEFLQRMSCNGKLK